MNSLNINNFKNIENELKYFILTINKTKNWNIDYKKYIYEFKHKCDLNQKKNERCLCRLWDCRLTGLNNNNDYDFLIKIFNSININKQCQNYSYKDQLCNQCYNKKEFHGYINEYPCDKFIQIYISSLEKLKKTFYSLDRTKYTDDQYKELSKILNRDIIREIDLNNYKCEKIKKKNLYKKISNNDFKEMSKIKQEINNYVVPDIKDKINKLDCLNGEIYQKWWDSYLIDKVKIYDNDSSSSVVLALEHNNDGNFLLNKNQQIIGEFKEWVDNNNQVLNCFKNKDNQILHPESAIPLIEYIIHKDSSIYHNITCKIYREYRYDSVKETLVNTNSIRYL